MAGITEQDSSCLERSNQTGTPWSPAWRAARHSMYTHPEMLGGFQIWFHFHPEFRYFTIWSDTLKFQDRVKCLLKGLCWCFGGKSTDCGATAAPVLHELSGSFSLSGNCCPPAHCVPLPVTKRSVQAVPKLSVLTTGLGSVPHRHELG